MDAYPIGNEAYPVVDKSNPPAPVTAYGQPPAGMLVGQHLRGQLNPLPNIPMGAEPQASMQALTPAPQAQAPQLPPMQNMASMASMMQPPAGAQPPMPTNQQAYPKSGGIGPNGFGLHPDTTQDELVDYLLPKFQAVESSGDPKNYPGKKDHLPYNAGDSGASGLYQYTPGTWGGYKGYARAMDAPPEIQTEKMKQDLKAALAKFGNDPYKTIANHLQPSVAHDPTRWSKPLTHSDGTPLKYKSGRTPPTVSEYVHKILQAGNDKAGGRLHKYLQGVNSRRQVSND
jgi:hypothetical protein